MDRWWAPHAGRLPGATSTPLPYKAPLDHILNLENALGHPKNEAEFGPDVPYRELSFLQNPRTPESVRNSVARIERCSPEADGSFAADCASGSAAAIVHDGTMRLQPGLTDVQLRTALSGVKEQFKVLHFASMNGTFSHFEEQADAERFSKRLRHMPSLWCCVNPPAGTPGHVWYDLQWDIIPHTDLHDRRWERPWNITLGP